jgi:isoprenylcysteine carboxyl methyltransferase (ICMT) family protein YpbQ
VRGMILKPLSCLFSLAKLLSLKWIMVISHRYLYLGITVWVTMNKVSYSSFSFLSVAGFILLAV